MPDQPVQKPTEPMATQPTQETVGPQIAGENLQGSQNADQTSQQSDVSSTYQTSQPLTMDAPQTPQTYPEPTEKSTNRMGQVVKVTGTPEAGTKRGKPFVLFLFVVFILLVVVGTAAYIISSRQNTSTPTTTKTTEKTIEVEKVTTEPETEETDTIKAVESDNKKDMDSVFEEIDKEITNIDNSGINKDFGSDTLTGIEE